MSREEHFILFIFPLCGELTDLVLVQLAVLELALSLLPEGDDDETHEDVHHEEGDDDDVDDEEDGDLHAVVVDGAAVDGVGVHGPVEQSVRRGGGRNKHFNLHSPGSTSVYQCIT